MGGLFWIPHTPLMKTDRVLWFEVLWNRDTLISLWGVFLVPTPVGETQKTGLGFSIINITLLGRERNQIVIKSQQVLSRLPEVLWRWDNPSELSPDGMRRPGPIFPSTDVGYPGKGNNLGWGDSPQWRQLQFQLLGESSSRNSWGNPGDIV